jgi:DNA-binding transcriptional MerR regulator
MPFTVSEIADRIRKPGQDRAAVVERIRHWTRERLLAPIGKRNPGTGRRRTYRDTSFLDAALLNEMADAGLQISTMRIALAVAQQIHTKWGKAKAEQGKRCFLSIYFPTNIPPYLHFGDGNPLEIEFETLIVFDLTQLFGRLKNEGE